MQPSPEPSFEFGPFRLEPGERRLLCGREPMAVAPKALDLLVLLVGEPDRLFKKDELMERLWPGVFVEEVNLAQNISALRRVLGGSGRQAYIQTVAGAGYRFVAPVRRCADSAGEKRQPRLLVLPFRMLKPDVDLDFLAFSLPDALAATLSALDAITVRSSLVAARFAGDSPDLPRIAREAQVDLVVSGTLLRARDQLRVSAQLSDASAGTLIWSHTDQAPIDDLFRLQDSLVARIADSLSRPLTAGEQKQLRHDVPATPKAYEYYLRANEASQGLYGFAIDRAIPARDLYLQSVREDPRYAPAWARLARVYRLIGKYMAPQFAHHLALADDALQRALALNPDLAMAHSLSAMIEVDRGQAEQAMVRLLGRLQSRGPNAEVFAGLVHACRFCGLLDASIAAHARGHRLDPGLGTSVMHTYFVLRRYDDVVRVSGEVKGYVFALSLAAQGRVAEAGAVVAGRPELLLVAARTLLQGRRADSAEALERALLTVSDPEMYYYAARHFAHLDRPRPALDALARAIGEGYLALAAGAADPWFDAIRAEPEFHRLVGKASEGQASAARAFRNTGGPELL